LAARIDDEAVLGAALRDIDVPPLRRRTGEYLAGGGAGGTQALIERRGRHRGALFLRRRLLPERPILYAALPVTDPILTRRQSAPSRAARLWGSAVHAPCPTSGCERASVTSPLGAIVIKSVIS